LNTGNRLRPEKSPAEHCASTGCPAWPRPGNNIQQQHDPGPVFIQSTETGDRTFPRCQCPALNFHIHEKLCEHTQQAGPKEDEARFICDIGPEHEFSRTQ